MKKFIPYLFLLWILPLSAQTTKQLDVDNGFGELKILADLDTVPDFVSIFKDPDVMNSSYEFAMFGSQYTYNGGHYQTIAGARIKKIFMTTVSVYITEIKVVCEHDSSVMDTLRSRYGPPTNNCVLVEDFENRRASWSLCIWQGRNVRLVVAAKKYYQDRFSKAADVPEYMYLKFTSVEGENLYKRF